MSRLTFRILRLRIAKGRLPKESSSLFWINFGLIFVPKIKLEKCLKYVGLFRKAKNMILELKNYLNWPEF